MPEDMPEDMPEHIAEDMPGRMPEDMPDRIREDMPDKMPEDMSDRMPEDLPVTKRINVMVGITRSKVIFFCGLTPQPLNSMGNLKSCGFLAMSTSAVVTVAPSWRSALSTLEGEGRCWAAANLAKQLAGLKEGPSKADLVSSPRACCPWLQHKKS